MTEVHVIPDERTTWRVYDAGTTEPVSEHTSATEAEFAAKARAERHGAERVVVHDRYHRTHELVLRRRLRRHASDSNEHAGWLACSSARASFPSSPVTGAERLKEELVTSVGRSWPAHAPPTPEFEVRCADVHSPGCGQAVRARGLGERP